MPGISHLVPMVEIAKLIAQRDDRFHITFLLFNHPPDKQVNAYIQSLDRTDDIFVHNRLAFLELPELENPVDRRSSRFLELLVEGYSPTIKQIIIQEKYFGSDSEGRRPAAGIIIDMFFTGLIDVANELNIPAFVLYTSSASSLALFFHFQTLRDQGVDVTELGDPTSDLEIPGFERRVPGWAVPMVVLEKDGGSIGFLNQIRRYRETKGIIVNTFTDVESSVIRSMSKDPGLPKIYDVGPIVNLNPTEGGAVGEDRESIVRWLDDHPPSSVVYLCFGSIGSFCVDQVREIADGLEKSGYRFVWSLRGHEKIVDVVPVGFLDRTAEIGKVIGWAPQIAILSHRAVGGFVSHCGWNSVLESLWFGVPIGAWPLYAEQQLNAYRLVEELGVGVDVKMDFRWDIRTKTGDVLVKAGVIEEGIRKLMDLEDEGLRSKVKAISQLIKKATLGDGSRSASLDRFIGDVFKN
ncbi:hypothetical protein Dimus_017048 [Dionaea muscipula]